MAPMQRLQQNYQIQLFFTALMFFTRIPCPTWVPYSEDRLNHASRYFPWVGLVVGGMGALVFWLGNVIFSVPVALLLSMATTIWITGAFHEDGFADLCDGFGGGWSRDQVLTIMKDSRLGTYGTVGLVLLLALKFSALLDVAPAQVPWLLLIGHTLSRFASGTFLYTHEYAREDLQSKAKPLATRLSSRELGIAAIGGMVPWLLGILFVNWWWGLAIVPVAIVRWWLGRLFVRRLGGYTGDCLGAAQQVTEVVFYLTCAMLLKIM